MNMITVKDLMRYHLENTFERETWQPPLGLAVRGLTAAQAAWTPSPERHSIWQIVRHVIHWKRAVLQAWAGDLPDYERLTREDWPAATGDQAAWEADVRALNDIYTEFRRRLEAVDGEGLSRSERWYQQARQSQPVAFRLWGAFTHDIYHAGQIQYLRALQEIPLDRFFTAAWDGNVARLRELLDAHPDLVHTHNGDGWTALHVASYSGQTDAVRFLLAREANVNATSRNSRAVTAAHCAITGWQSGKRTEIAALLLTGGADPVAADPQGNTLLHVAAREGSLETMDLLIRRGLAINPRRKDGATPLRIAMDEGQLAVADLLRKLGGAE